MTNREAAHTLYNEGYQLEEIAKLLRVPYNTIAKYSSDGNWKKLKAEKGLREKTSQERIWGLIEFQLQIIERITTKHKEALLNENLDVKDLQSLLISKGDIDALQKLHTTIKGKDISWDQMVKLFREFLEFTELENLNVAKNVAPFVTEFLNKKRESL